jgi:hypothetical protein
MSADPIRGAQTHCASDVQTLCEMCDSGDWTGVPGLLHAHPSLALVELNTSDGGTTTLLRRAIRHMCAIDSACCVVDRILASQHLASPAASHVDADGALPMHELAEPRSTLHRRPLEVLDVLAAAYPAALARATHSEGWTPLHVASTFGWNLAFFQRLIHLHPLACCATDKNGYLPAHLVCTHSKCIDKVQALLRVHPAAINVVTNDGHTMLSLAASCNGGTVNDGLVNLLTRLPLALQSFRGPSSWEAGVAGRPTHIASATHREGTHAHSWDANLRRAIAYGSTGNNAEIATVPARRARRSGASSAVTDNRIDRLGWPAQDPNEFHEAQNPNEFDNAQHSNEVYAAENPNEHYNANDPKEYCNAQDPKVLYEAETTDRQDKSSRTCDDGDEMLHGVTHSPTLSEALRNVEVCNNNADDKASSYDDPTVSSDVPTKHEQKENHHPNVDAFDSQLGTSRTNRDGSIKDGCRRPLSGGRSPDVSLPSKKPRLSSDFDRGRSHSHSTTDSREDKEAPQSDGAVTPSARSPDPDSAITSTPGGFLPIASPIVTKGPSSNRLDRVSMAARTQLHGEPLATSPIQPRAGPRQSPMGTKCPASDGFDRLTTLQRDHEEPLATGGLLSPLQAARHRSTSNAAAADRPVVKCRPFMRTDWSKRNLSATFLDASSSPDCPEHAAATADRSRATCESIALGISAETPHDRVNKNRTVWRAMMVIGTLFHLVGAVAWWWQPTWKLPSSRALRLRNRTAEAMSVATNEAFEEKDSATPIPSPYRSDMELESSWRILSVDSCHATESGCYRISVALTTASSTETFTALGPCPCSIMWDDQAGQVEGPEPVEAGNDPAHDDFNDSYANYAWHKLQSVRASWLHP